MKRVVAVSGVKAELYIVFGPPAVSKHLSRLEAGVAFNLRYQAADAFFRIVMAERQNPLGKGIRASAGFAGPIAPTITIPV
jgi:hypothetical protein